jgi:hypothetical protein
MMSRDEVVRLVSRALAVSQFISALEEITYLPERMFAVHHYHQASEGLILSYTEVLYRFEISSLLFRIAGLLTLAWLFWTCGPRVAQLLLPEEVKEAAGAPGEDSPATMK